MQFIAAKHTDEFICKNHKWKVLSISSSVGPLIQMIIQVGMCKCKRQMHRCVWTHVYRQPFKCHHGSAADTLLAALSLHCVAGVSLHCLASIPVPSVFAIHNPLLLPREHVSQLVCECKCRHMCGCARILVHVAWMLHVCCVDIAHGCCMDIARMLQ